MSTFGPEYRAKFDKLRIVGQMKAVFDIMLTARIGLQWLTLEEISKATNAPAASVSAQLRHLRKERFGKHTILKRRRGDPRNGLYEYQMVPTIPCERPVQVGNVMHDFERSSGEPPLLCVQESAA